MTARQAINKECRDCCNSVNFRSVCCSFECSLHPAKEFKSSLRRIKAHCTECNPSKTVLGIKDCGGDKCNLYPFRLGKNPFKPKRTPQEPSESQKLARERFKTRTQRHAETLISHNSPKAGGI